MIYLTQSKIIYSPLLVLSLLEQHILSSSSSPSFLSFFPPTLQHKLTISCNSFGVWVFDSWVWFYICQLWAWWGELTPGKDVETMGDGTSGRRIVSPLQENRWDNHSIFKQVRRTFLRQRKLLEKGVEENLWIWNTLSHSNLPISPHSNSWGPILSFKFFNREQALTAVNSTDTMKQSRESYFEFGFLMLSYKYFW